MAFGALDWTIVIVSLVLSVLTGVVGRKYVGQVAPYLVAGRELGPCIGIATLAAAGQQTSGQAKRRFPNAASASRK